MGKVVEIKVNETVSPVLVFETYYKRKAFWLMLRNIIRKWERSIFTDDIVMVNCKLSST